MRHSFVPILLIAFAAFASTPAFAQTPEDLKRMTLEQVLDIEVTTASKVPTPASAVPAAVFVMTQDDIRRSGATSIPEVLRLVPGMQVARINGGTWSIGVRGFADRLARSMLVLMDGRPVYSALFAGTYWETQDTLLADIDRIEVIRGPGGTLWGANAVNGIVNIITKSAKESQGLLVDLGAGSEDRASAAFRYGATAGSLTYRSYIKAVDRGPEFHANGNNYDGWRAAQGGVRADWALAAKRTLTLQGDLYDGRLGERTSTVSYQSPFNQPTNLSAPLLGGNALARLSGPLGTQSDFQLQMFYDRTNRDEIPVAERRDTGDVDFQQTVRSVPRQALTWGAGYRVTSGRITAAAPTVFSPASRTDHLFSAFLQDEVTLVPDRLRLTVGTKVEHNAYTSFEAQPTVRVAWTSRGSQTIWGAITRAVRTPSRVETDYTTTSLVSASPTLTFVRLTPNPDFQDEKLRAYELGYRLRPVDRVYVTVSSFYNVFNDTLSTELLTPFVETSPAPVRLVLPVTFGNGLDGHGQGAEITADVRPLRSWRLTANYSYLTIAMAPKPGGHDVSQEQRYEGGSPHHQLQAGSSIDLSRWSVDWQVRYVSRLVSPSVPSYTAADLRVGYQLTPRVELSLVGRDLFSSRHLEWPSSDGNVEIERSVYARLLWH